LTKSKTTRNLREVFCPASALDALPGAVFDLIPILGLQDTLEEVEQDPGFTEGEGVLGGRRGTDHHQLKGIEGRHSPGGRIGPSVTGLLDDDPDRVADLVGEATRDPVSTRGDSLTDKSSELLYGVPHAAPLDV